MNQSVKCLLLKNSDILVSELIEVGSELGEPDCKLVYPYKMIQKSDSDDIFLEPWITFTNQTEMMIHSSNILTIVNPTQKILDLYNTLVS
jgi:hypothetical protein